VIGGVALAAAVGLTGWHFWGGRGEVLKPEDGPVVTVMDFGRSFPLDPLPSGWRHRKFWTRSPMTMAFAVKDGVPSMRFETRDSASMLFRQVDIDLAVYPTLAWRWYIELPIRSPLDERTREGDDHPARLFLRFVTDRGEKRAMEVIWGNRLRPGDYKCIGGFPHFVPMPATIGSAASSTRGSTSPGSMPRSGRMRRRRTWSMSPGSATATTRTRPALAISPMSGLNGVEARTPVRRIARVEEDDDENGFAYPRLVFGPRSHWLKTRDQRRSPSSQQTFITGNSVCTRLFLPDATLIPIHAPTFRIRAALFLLEYALLLE